MTDKISYDGISYPLCFSKWDKILMFLFPRSYDPWFDAFVSRSPVTVECENEITDEGEIYYAEIKNKRLVLTSQKIIE